MSRHNRTNADFWELHLRSSKSPLGLKDSFLDCPLVSLGKQLGRHLVFRQSLNEAKLWVDEAFVTTTQAISPVTMSSPDSTLADSQEPALALETPPDLCFATQHTCPIRHVLDILSSKWSVLLLREFLQGPRRTSQLREALPGISSKTLAANLHTFERQGLLHRHVYAEVPPHVEYSLTVKGQEIRPLLVALYHLGTHWLEQEPCVCPIEVAVKE